MMAEFHPRVWRRCDFQPVPSHLGQFAGAHFVVPAIAAGRFPLRRPAGARLAANDLSRPNDLAPRAMGRPGVRRPG